VIYEPSYLAIGVFAFFVGLVLVISFYLGSKAKSASGYYAAHGQIPWFVNGIAFAGDYLSAASFLGICGMIAFYGYDGFLYSIGFLAGWVVALLVIAEPLKRLGKFTFADALDSQFNSRGIKLAAAISTLVVSIFYLIPQMVGAGSLVKPLLGLSHSTGVITVGVVVILIVTTAGMVSTTWVQFIKGGMLVIFCAVLTVMILLRGLSQAPPDDSFAGPPKLVEMSDTAEQAVIPESGTWSEKPYLRKRLSTGEVVTWRYQVKEGKRVYQFISAPGKIQLAGGYGRECTQNIERPGKYAQATACQTMTVNRDGSKLVNGLPIGRGDGKQSLTSVGYIEKLPPGISGASATGPLGPVEYIHTLQESTILLWGSEKVTEDDGSVTTVYYRKLTPGSEVLTPGGSPTFAGVRSDDWRKKLDFLSLMTALFCGTASLPHILIRYYTVKDQASARKSTVVGIAAIGFFYVLTLFLGLGAMTSGTLDVTDSNMAAPLLARSFGELPFAVISAIAFTTVLGTVSGLIMAASGAVAHDLLANFCQIEMNDHAKVRAGKITAVFVGMIAIVLGIWFQKLNVGFLVGWAFNVAASANLPALVMLLFWRGTTKQGITAAIFVGMIASLAWILLSQQCYRDVYGLPPEKAIVPFSQPGIVTIPLGFVVLVGVSLVTRGTAFQAVK
jgi:cation/acetate symporter